ncbi:winged helix-turn-helix transcriptional regulator [Rothia sp. P6271]|uniref:winged helix-turn-helix transcriptional regulator n=1 Tax=unclassified Rothia (in: high G+C Gram-positive bacteria) TaxID=2689056 RepID=UPI003AD32908
MLHILLLSDLSPSPVQVLPALDLLSHRCEQAPLNLSVAQIDTENTDVVFIDAREALVTARNTAQLLKAAGLSVPVVMVLTEGGMAAVSNTWMVDDIILDSAGPAELEARLRLVTAHIEQEVEDSTVIRSGSVTIDEASYTARLHGTPLNLTYKEFELLKFLAQHTGRVFTRSQLLSEVWGYDYFGGTRTVDVHIRRLRSKLGIEHEHLISTVRNVGYSFNAPRS